MVKLQEASMRAHEGTTIQQINSKCTHAQRNIPPGNRKYSDTTAVHQESQT